MPLIVPPALRFPLPIIKPLRTPTEIHEATGKPVLWKTSEFRLVYKGYELREFSKALASGATNRAALKHALNATRLKQVGGQLNQTIEGAKLAQLPEVQRAVVKYKDKARRAVLMDMIERRGHCARVARRSSTAPNAVINAVMADAKLAGEFDETTKVDVTFAQVLQSIQAAQSGMGGNGMLPMEGELVELPKPTQRATGGMIETQETEPALEIEQGDPMDGGARIVGEIEMDEDEDVSTAEAVFGEIEDE